MRIPHHKIDCDYDTFRDKFILMNNLEYVDSGCFASVYEPNSKSDYVYKIGRLNSTRHDGYLCFIKNIVLKSKNNPFVPIIHAMSMYSYYDEWEKRDGYFYIIKMERLHNYGSISEKRCHKLLLEHNIDPSININGFWGSEEGWLDDWESYLDGDEWVSGEKHFMHNYPKKLGAMLTKMRKMVKDTDHIEGDVHGGNVMWRKTGGHKRQLVLTDPLC